MGRSSEEFSYSSARHTTHRRRVATSDSSSTPHRHRRQQSDPSNVEYDDDYSQTYTPQEGASAAEDRTGYADDEAPLSSYSDNQTHSQTSIPPPAYINIAPLPIFRGTHDECPVAHFSRFERVCRANNATTIDMKSRIFPVTLDGEAALWYELAIEPDPSLSWADVKAAFLRTYRQPDFVERSRAELMGLKQGEEEGVNSYYLRMQWILKRWPDHGVPDALLRGIFVDGLREDYQDWIVPQRPGTLQEAVRMALSWEQARSVRAARRRGEVKCGFCDGGHEEEGCEVRMRMKELWLRSKEGSEVGSSSLRRSCQCWKHQCWKKLERSSSAVAPEENPVNAD